MPPTAAQKAIKAAARVLGGIRTAKKAAAARRNGLKGGRPPLNK